MKSASKILIIVGAVFSFIGVLALLITSGVFFYLASPGHKADIVAALKDGSMTSTFTGTPEEVADSVQLLFKVLAVVFIVISVFYLITPVVSLIASGRDSKGLFILGLVLSVLGFDILLILGNLFGLLDDSSSQPATV